MRLIERLLGWDYQLLRRIQSKIGEFEKSWGTESQPWWQHKTWSAASSYPQLAITKPSRKRIFFLLHNTVRMYRDYLRLRYLGSSDSRTDETIDFWMRPLIVQVGRIVECIHGFERIRKKVDPGLPYGDKFGNGATIGGRRGRHVRCDWFGQSLYDIRNIAAHFNPDAPRISENNLRSLLAALFAWLSVAPPCFSTSERPDIKEFFDGPRTQVSLVRAYESLFGSRIPDLPDWEE
jgi:hypothetical protein